ncbi:MAG TPA: alpha amylase C-terminal domain-containing protein, partial [Thermoanaerobaculia bacterium]|nr:alpha amylase C-terminal domain-containing protein [Thermoanaerobaculia bacterium]
LEAVDFLRALNEVVHRELPAVQTYAEESTAWPGVSRPTGLGFGFKWDMGWMHDTLKYLARNPIYRKYHHNELTFRTVYAWNESFVLPLSHDEVVHVKGSLVNKMPGDTWQKLANLRLLYGYMYAQPGKKLLFMGAELAQWREWNHETSLDWFLLEDPGHAGISRWLQDLNRVYREERALYELDGAPEGFEWLDADDALNSVLSFFRLGEKAADLILVVLNFTPVPRESYRVGVPQRGFWTEILNSDAADYAGSGKGNMGGVETSPVPLHGRAHSLILTLPPLGVIFLKAPGAGGAASRR